MKTKFNNTSLLFIILGIIVGLLISSFIYLVKIEKQLEIQNDYLNEATQVEERIS